MIQLILDLVGILGSHLVKCNERLPLDEQRNGGYLCVFHNFNGAGGREENLIPLVIMRIGIPIQDKEEKYFLLCQEKARRLMANPEHLSSWQSRNVEEERYGGAIRTPNYILAFSGLTEKADEAILVNAALELEMLDISSASAIASHSGNELISV